MLTMNTRRFSQNRILRSEFSYVSEYLSELGINASSSELGLVVVKHLSMVSNGDGHILKKDAQ